MDALDVARCSSGPPVYPSFRSADIGLGRGRRLPTCGTACCLSLPPFTTSRNPFLINFAWPGHRIFLKVPVRVDWTTTRSSGRVSAPRSRWSVARVLPRVYVLACDLRRDLLAEVITSPPSGSRARRVLSVLLHPPATRGCRTGGYRVDPLPAGRFDRLVRWLGNKVSLVTFPARWPPLSGGRALIVAVSIARPPVVAVTSSTIASLCGSARGHPPPRRRRLSRATSRTRS